MTPEYAHNLSSYNSFSSHNPIASSSELFPIHFNFLEIFTALLSFNRFPIKYVLPLLVLTTMSEGAAPTRLLAEYTLPPFDDPLFDFITKDWYEPPSFVMHSPETDNERYRRLADKTTYMTTASTTHWHMYAIVVRHTVEGPWFDEILNNFPNNPSTFHHLVWYEFVYHVDRKIDNPERLQTWAMSISQPFMDNNGMLYNWNSEGSENPKVI
jgi:hypothetical protein